MGTKAHWESVYKTKGQEAVSWFLPHLDISLDLIERLAPVHSAAIIDVGAGSSTLTEDLVRHGYSNLTVLDISETALSVAKRRLGRASEQIHWLAADVCEADLPSNYYDVWHDRAVFHFLIFHEQRTSYVAKAAQAVKGNGYLIVCTFGPEGLTRCSGLDTARYDATGLAAEFSAHFVLRESRMDWHTAPSGEQQQFLYAAFQRDHRPVQAE